MVGWHSRATPAQGLYPGAAPGGISKKSPGSASGQPAEAWPAWQRRLWRELIAGAVPYAVAHFLFYLHSHRGGDIDASTVDLQAAQLLFLLGTVLLSRVAHSLSEPHVPPPGGSLRQAGLCLALVIALAFSPGVWWLLSLAGW